MLTQFKYYALREYIPKKKDEIKAYIKKNLYISYENTIELSKFCKNSLDLKITSILVKKLGFKLKIRQSEGEFRYTVYYIEY